MTNTTFALVASVSAAFWLAFGYLLVRVWRHDHATDPTYEPDPEDGCGCVELWEHLSEQRGRARGSNEQS